ncbi:hypothetical protein QWY93_05715 [Echinicola jeungdonensis]|uniref:Uncharacterized protein n=1 Tax=Echinicola jeungdonensis TaxID=709343 RepID=A0ABV5J4W0_9BACT|nr:hypothetical protein [Echinicola jeungdonensis]MDN3668820.1 hypothetical protein [Echinicola jeungdonensis]
MNDKINLNYLESYSDAFTNKICSEFFGTKKYMTGQEIIQFTPSTQVNLLIIKTLFEKWQEEIEKIKGNPFFDYRDVAVSEALKDFMKVLSRAIKIEKPYFQPLMKEAVMDAAILAVDPLVYFFGEIDKSEKGNMRSHFKTAKKYIKWHPELLKYLSEKAENNPTKEELEKALGVFWEKYVVDLESTRALLQPLEKVKPIDWEELIPEPDTMKEESQVKDLEGVKEEEKISTTVREGEPIGVTGSETIDPALAWAHFESEQSGILKGPISSLEDGVAINQRFMFTKSLFDGNPDLMAHAFKLIDNCDSFVEAIELINERYVKELSWDKESEEVREFLQLVYRKFDEK